MIDGGTMIDGRNGGRRHDRPHFARDIGLRFGHGRRRCNRRRQESTQLVRRRRRRTGSRPEVVPGRPCRRTPRRAARSRRSTPVVVAVRAGIPTTIPGQGTRTISAFRSEPPATHRPGDRPPRRPSSRGGHRVRSLAHPTLVVIRPWIDPVVDDDGHDPARVTSRRSGSACSARRRRGWFAGWPPGSTVAGRVRGRPGRHGEGRWGWASPRAERHRSARRSSGA